jgi:hypothetical protein
MSELNIENLCIDEISIIMEYLNYYDLFNVNLTNNFWNNIVSEVTTFPDYIKILKLSKISKFNPKHLFYYCCENNHLNIARRIVNQENIIFKNILNDVFYLKLCSPTYENIIRIMNILKIDHLKIGFEQNILDNLEKNIGEISLFEDKKSIYINKCRTYLFWLCMNHDDDFLEFQALCLLGNSDIITLNDAFLSCCHFGNIQKAQYIHSLTKISKDTLRNAIIASYGRSNLDLFKWLCSFKIVDNEMLKFVFRYACIYNRLIHAQYISSISDITTDKSFVEDALRLYCCRINKEIMMWLVSLHSDINESIIQSCFNEICMSNDYNMVKVLYESREIDPKFVKKCYFNAIKKNCLNTVKYLIHVFCSKECEEIIKDSIRLSRICDHTNIVNYLLSISN